MAATTADVTFSPKRPEDIELFSINFAKLVPASDSIVNASVAISVRNGPARDCSTMPVGQPNVNGLLVSQFVGGGLNNLSYDLRFIIDTQAGIHLEIVGELMVRE